MINKINIDETNTIWKLHYDVEFDTIYVELRNDKTFVLKDTISNKVFSTKNYEQYVQNILSIQYPYLVLSYRHLDNLLDDQIISLYNIETEKEEWISSDIRVEEIYHYSLKVYHPKISPKSFYYINFQKENIDKYQSFSKLVNIVYADNVETSTELIDENLKVYIDFEAEILQLYENNKLIYTDNFYLIEDYRPEYEYLMKINDFIVFILGKHKMNIYQIKPNNC